MTSQLVMDSGNKNHVHHKQHNYSKKQNKSALATVSPFTHENANAAPKIIDGGNHEEYFHKSLMVGSRAFDSKVQKSTLKGEDDLQSAIAATASR